MPKLTLVIDGPPISKNRPRFGKGRTYSDQKQESLAIQWEIKSQLPKGFQPLTGAVELQFFFFMPIPTSTSKKRQEMMLKNEIKHTTGKDLDNLIKMVKDCMNKIVYNDDSQVWKYPEAIKVYSLHAHTQILVGWD